VTLTVDGLPAAAGQRGWCTIASTRRTATRSPPGSGWARRRPRRPSNTQLEKAGRLERLEAPAMVPLHDSQVTLAFTLPRQAVSLLVLEWD